MDGGDVMSHPGTDSAVTRYCPFSGITPNGFVSGSCLPASFPAGHPSWDYSGASKLNFGVPIPSEATAPPKRVVLD